jgi:hypothetical protein
VVSVSFFAAITPAIVPGMMMSGFRPTSSSICGGMLFATG